jgi:hypothetical protein
VSTQLQLTNISIPYPTHTQTGAVYISCEVRGTDKNLNVPLLNTRNPEIPAFVEAVVFATRIFHEKSACILKRLILNIPVQNRVVKVSD